ncbi:nicotinate (nicotinamide) nucleotide adenylyltransferase [Carboxylicivirga taeanensis]|uniref:nicotinate (nicotinamide) nucleotide adenylyltransferase n=1 Tax=Carboxylicivirga taeanensis TaxID=1416875 RepID=UPI003F6E3D6D
MKKVGLFFGSFNPIHIGHLALANYMLEFENQDEVWFVVSPQNPFKETDELISAPIRVEMVRLATQKHEKYRVEDIELSLPKPSYTIDTLNALNRKYPQHQFSIIMGADNIMRFKQWKQADRIAGHYPVFVYPRIGYQVNEQELPHKCKLTQAPIIEIASSDIRQWIKDGRQTPYLVPEPVFSFIQNKQLYQ